MKPIFSVRNSLVFFLCVLLLPLLQGCREDTILNGALVPVDDTINTVIVPDTITILSRTFFRDTLLTSTTLAGVPVNHALGTLSTDPYTGKTDAAIYFQVIPPSLNFIFPKVPDSAVLVLPYAGLTWGDTNLVPQHFMVYEVKDTVSVAGNYYSNAQVNVDRSAALGAVDISSYKTLQDSVFADKSLQAPHLRIRLNDGFIQHMKNAADAGTDFGSYADFVKWFNGFCIEPAAGNAGNALFYFRLDGSSNYTNAGLLFYYTEGIDSVVAIPFAFNPSYNAHFNTIARDYAGTPVADLLASTAASDSVFILQNEPGAVADLKFPFLKNFTSAPLLRAELVITQYSFAGDNVAVYTPPERIYPIGVNATGELYTILDRYPLNSIEPWEFMGGKRKTITIGSTTVSQYVLNIPREVQKTITEQRDTLHLRVSGASGFPGAYRMVGGGTASGNTITNVKLNLVFSKNK